MKVTLAQLNPIVGDIRGNLSKIKGVVEGSAGQSDLIIFPELFICGYPPRDLLEKPVFIDNVAEAVEQIVELSCEYPECGIIVGAPMPTQANTEKNLYNSALLIYSGKILLRENKSLLPTYDVFDEERYFQQAREVKVVEFKGSRVGISICEDMWNGVDFFKSRTYSFNPIEALVEQGATVIFNISASPFYAGKDKVRYNIIRNHAKKHGVTFVFVNQVGGNDELIFDGSSICVDKEGREIAVLPSFEECVETVDLDARGTEGLFIPQEKTEAVYNALVTGVRDYMKKCFFSKAVIGLSGGVDSSLTACIAAEAAGKENVLGVLMPSPYTSKESVEYSIELAENIGIKHITIPVTEVYNSYISALSKQVPSGEEVDITFQNIQARIRGNILMALSNRFGYLVLSTGNKSELSVGYSTLYGDLAGGLAVISDVPKTLVYKIAGYINRESEIIPSRIIQRPPSAELKPNQTDQELLPPYEILDEILACYIEQNQSFKEIVDMGFEAQTVEWVIDAVNRNEYKRRQSPPGLKVTTKAFGTGRRMPIAMKLEKKYKERIEL